MAGSNPDFPSDEFRAGIRFVYQMAEAPDDEERATFYFPGTLVYNSSVDGENVPFDPHATVTTTPPRPVRNVPCGVEYFDAQGNEIAFGTVTPSAVAITLLDQDYAKVKGCAYVVVGGDKYWYRHQEAPSGLFDVGLYTLHFRAENEL